MVSSNAATAEAYFGEVSTVKTGKVTSVYRFDDIESRVYAAKSRVELFSDQKFVSDFFSKVDSLLPEKGVLSLDIFDTLLLRDNSSELTRFFEVGKLMSSFVR